MKIKGLLLLMVAALMMTTQANAQLSFGKATLFNDGWSTTKQGEKTVMTKHFDMKDIRNAETYHLYFEGIGGRSEIRLNGKKSVATRTLSSPSCCPSTHISIGKVTILSK